MSKKPKLPFDTFIEVVWDDAVSDDGWVDIKSIEPVTRVVTRGWLVQDIPESITLANSIFVKDKETVGGSQTIPRGMIFSSRILKVTSARIKL